MCCSPCSHKESDTELQQQSRRLHPARASAHPRAQQVRVAAPLAVSEMRRQLLLWSDVQEPTAGLVGATFLGSQAGSPWSDVLHEQVVQCSSAGFWNHRRPHGSPASSRARRGGLSCPECSGPRGSGPSPRGEQGGFHALGIQAPRAALQPCLPSSDPIRALICRP